MGMETGTALLLSSLIGAGAGVGKSLMQPDGQRFSSFQGTDNDPGTLLSNANSKIADVFKLAMGNAQTPPDLSDAYIQDSMPRHGDTLPMDFGVGRATWGGGSKPAAPVAAPDADPLTSLLRTLPATTPPAAASTAMPTIPTSGSGKNYPPSVMKQGAQPGVMDALQAILGGEMSDTTSGPTRLPYLPKTAVAQAPSPGVGGARMLLHLAAA